MTQAVLARLLGMSQQAVVKLAKIFGLSIEALTGMSIPVRPKRRLSPAGIRHAERFQQLSKTEQRFVNRIIDVLLERSSCPE